MEVNVKKVIIMVVLASMLALSMTGCFGNFSLVRKVYTFNQGIGDNGIGGRFVRTLVFYVMNIIPVYGVAGLIDYWILNLIEFWTGSNPLAMSENEMEVRYATAEGKEYEIVTTQNRYDIKEVNNPENAVAFVYSPEESAWYMHSGDGSYKITEDDGDMTHFFNLESKAVATVFN